MSGCFGVRERCLVAGECLDNEVGEKKMRHKSGMVGDGLAMKGKSRDGFCFVVPGY
jgi:hypothetical protein